MPTAFIETLSEIADRYDGFLLDLWGVIHDGQELYPKAAQTLKKLQEQGKRIVFLSNAPRRSAKLHQGLARMGIAREQYQDVVCSGEVAWQMLEHRSDPFFAELGTHFYFIGPERDRDYPESLSAFKEAQYIDKSDFLLCVGVEHDFQQLVELRSVLEKSRERNLPVLCVNPDEVVVNLAGERKLCAGAIAREYERMGGKARFIGKPYAEVYETALGLLSDIPKDRILALGDTPETDIRGANRFHLATCLIRSGILSIELPAVGLDPARQETIISLLKERKVTADFCLPRFAWA